MTIESIFRSAATRFAPVLIASFACGALVGTLVGGEIAMSSIGVAVVEIAGLAAGYVAVLTALRGRMRTDYRVTTSSSVMAAVASPWLVRTPAERITTP